MTKLRMSATTAPFLHKTSWRAHGQWPITKLGKEDSSMSGKGSVPGEGLGVRGLYLDGEDVANKSRPALGTFPLGTAGEMSES